MKTAKLFKIGNSQSLWLALRSFLLIFLAFPATANPAAAAPATAKMPSILVYPFENTGDTQYSWISEGMTDRAVNDLRGIKEVNVISHAERKKIMTEGKFILSGLAAEETIVKVGKLTGVEIIVTGSYRVSGKNIRVIVRLINVETGNIESSAALDGSLGNILDLQDKVVLTLLSQAGKMNLPGVNRIRIPKTEKKRETKPRPKTAAYECYARGLELQDANPKEALAWFTKAIAIDKNYVDALIAAGVTAGGTLRLFDEASGYLARTGTILKSRGAVNTTDYAALMHTIGVVSWSKGDLDRAIKHYRDAQQTWDRLGFQNTADYAGLLANIGMVYDAKGDLDRAMNYYRDAQQTEDKLGLQNTPGYAGLLVQIGNVYGAKGDLDRAMNYYRVAQQTGDTLGLQDTPGYAGLLVQIGNVYDARGDLYHALKYYLDSRQIQDKLGLQDTAGYAGLLVDIGILHFSKEDFDRALEYYRDSQQIRDKLGLQNTAGYAGLMMNIGNVYGSKGDLNRAMRHYLDAQQIWDRLGFQNKAVYAGLIFSMGRIYEIEGDRRMAGRYYRDAYDSYVRAGYTGPLKDRAFRKAQQLGY